jgi:hypothetical protein
MLNTLRCENDKIALPVNARVVKSQPRLPKDNVIDCQVSDSKGLGILERANPKR